MTMGPQPGQPPVSLLNQPQEPGVFNQGWQYPLGDPQAALRNWMREHGGIGDPFNQKYQGMINSTAQQAFAQYLSALANGRGASTTSLQGDFGDYLGNFMGGGVPTPTIGQAGQQATQVADMLYNLKQKVQGIVTANGGQMPQNAAQWTQQLQQMGQAGQLSQIDMALAGYMSDPRNQAQFMQDITSRQLGPTMSAGLATARAPMLQNWSDYQEAGAGPSMTSLMDILQNRPRTGTMMPPSSTTQPIGSPAPNGPPPSRGADIPPVGPQPPPTPGGMPSFNSPSGGPTGMIGQAPSAGGPLGVPATPPNPALHQQNGGGTGPYPSIPQGQGNAAFALGSQRDKEAGGGPMGWLLPNNPLTMGGGPNPLLPGSPRTFSLPPPPEPIRPSPIQPQIAGGSSSVNIRGGEPIIPAQMTNPIEALKNVPPQMWLALMRILNPQMAGDRASE